MESHTRKLLIIVTEAALEGVLSKEIEKLGAHGFTITDARGKGGRGVRSAHWEASSNIRIEVVCDPETAEAIIGHVRKLYYDNYAMIVLLSDVQVLRPDKF